MSQVIPVSRWIKIIRLTFFRTFRNLELCGEIVPDNSWSGILLHVFFQRLLFLTLEDTPRTFHQQFMKEILSFGGGFGEVWGYLPCGQNHRFFTIPKMAPPTNDIRMVILGSTIDLPKRNRCWSCGRRNFSAKKNSCGVFFLRRLQTIGIELLCFLKELLAGGFKHFLFISLPGEMIPFDSYFSNGLKPPTRLVLF